ncbi:SH3 domain-containing protein [Thalassoporum mexicanum]|uniref:SH3 domain-containing protein n=1 Tax=Thalassoporum mexicanum TaxID=3457544 RepID=UPI0018DD212C|nr:SH3 domain-containing protein [Pseudanabaena sp. PCC 7367]
MFLLFKRSPHLLKVTAIACLVIMIAPIAVTRPKSAFAQKYNCDAGEGRVRCTSENVKLSPNGVPPRAEPGWSLWFDDSRRDAADFDAGFSNLELGGYMEFEAICQRDTGLESGEVDYWFRLDNSLQEIGTGRVEFGCWQNQRFVHRFSSTAVRRSLNIVTCLLVDSPVGNGLVVRSEPGFNSRRLGVVANQTEVEPVGYPALIITANDRDWLKITAPIEGWVSNGSPISKGNLRLCG